MDRKKCDELSLWMAQASTRIPYGRITVEIIMHAGKIQRVIREISESELLKKPNEEERQ